MMDVYADVVAQPGGLIVSAVVCTHGRPELLTECVASLSAALGGQDELIVADSGDSGASTALTAGAQGAAPAVHLHSKRAGKSYKLNRAVELARGDVLVITDDDCEVDAGWVEAMTAPFAFNPSVGVAFGPVRGLPTVGHAPLPSIPPGEAPLETWPFAHGAAMAVRTAAVRDAGGFDERMGPGAPVPGGEDHDLVLRMRERGWRAWIADAPPVRHTEWRDAAEHRRSLLTYQHGSGVVLGAAVRRRRPDSARLLARRLRYQRALLAGTNAEGRMFGLLALGGFLGGVGRGLARRPRRWLYAVPVGGGVRTARRRARAGGRASVSRTVHVVEPGGWGGVYQHAAAVAAFLAEAGMTVVLHTAGDAEDVPLPPSVSRRSCFWRFADLRARPLRRCAVVAGWLLAGVPRCLTRMRPGDVVHIEGRFFPLLLLPLFVGARLRRCTVAFSPHNTFPRRAGYRARPAREWLVRWLARRADVVFAFSDHDRSLIEGWGAQVARVPLAIGAWALTADPERVTAWRRRWGATGDVERPVVLFAGQIRHDKGLDLAVLAAAQWRQDAVLAVVGEDHGALAGALRAGSMRGVDVVVDEGYQPLPQLAAALAAADVVICPYREASMSAVLAMATALGRPTVATDVGGLVEVATVVVPPGDAGALAAGVDKALASDPRPPSWPDPRQLAGAYLSAYDTTGAD